MTKLIWFKWNIDFEELNWRMNLQHGKLLKLEKYNDYFVRFQIVLFRILGLIMFYCNKEILINREKSGKWKITKDRR
jgi:hypothetical protein